MKCPKCGYLGFEALDRCRNCGYDFSFAPASNLPELRIRSDLDRDMQPLEDLALVDAVARARHDERRREDGVDLPLFGPAADDVPLISRPSPPRSPLSVRRATPDPRLRTEPRSVPANPTPLLDLGPPDVTSRSIESKLSNGHLRGSKTNARGNSATPEAAGVASRLLAVIVDVAVLAAIDAVVIYFTMQICGLTPGDIGLLPKGPLIAFLVVQNGGYLVTFTAGGQTLGKMAAGIRVVSTDSDRSVDLGRSIVRTIVWALLAIPAGLGFLTALFSSDRRGLHDRCARTRVVRATA